MLKNRQFLVQTIAFFRVNRVKFHLSNPRTALPRPERRIMTYCACECVQRCDSWAWRRNKKGQIRSCDTL